ncbi:MAG: tandem-95 repeat protein, partial [Hyphomicrobiales bacterium]|nr:tandem-95 repeat protein [Hyphomicrobiales bacterium]
TIPAGAFSDVDGDNLVMSATLADGSALPQWLSFDGSTFSGTPPQDFNGMLELLVSATDGEFSASDSFQLTINALNDAPIIANSIADQSFDEDTLVSFAVPSNTFSDVEGDALTLTATMGDGTDLPSWLAFDGASFTGTPPLNFNGALALHVSASDGELEVAADFNLTIEAINDNPVVIDLIADQTSIEDQAFSFAIPDNLFDDVDGDVLTISSRLANGGDLPAWINFTGTQFNGTPPPDFNGSLEIHVVADDGTASTTTSFTFEITPLNDAPVVAGTIDDYSGAEDQPVSFSLPAGLFTDVDGDTLIRTARLASGAALPAWLLFDGSSFAGTPPQDFNGTLALSVEASDGEYAAEAQFNLVIAPVNDAPSTDTIIIDQSITEDQVFSFDLPADAFSDIDGDNLTITVAMPNGDPLPAWLTFNGSTFSGTPPQDYNTANSGPLGVVVTASDGELETSQTFDLDVTAVDDPVTLANPLSDQSSDEDQLFSYTLPEEVFVDVDGDALTVAASLDDGSALPTWLSFDGATFSGTPPQDFNGLIDLQLIASDGNSQAVDEFTLTISPVNDAPVAQDDFDFAVDENSSLTILANDLLANDSDVDGDVLSIVSVQTDGDASVSLDANGDVVYAPDTGFIGNDSFTYTLSDGTATSDAFVGVSVEKLDNPYDDWETGTEGSDLIIGDRFDSNKIYGAGGDDILIGGRRADQIDGGTGDDLIFGGSGQDILNGNEGSDLIFGGRGQDTITGGSQDDILFGGRGSDTFVFGEGSGHDVIVDYNSGARRPLQRDNISINFDGIDNFSDLMAIAQQSGRSVVFDFGDGDTLVLAHTRLAALDQDAFT